MSSSVLNVFSLVVVGWLGVGFVCKDTGGGAFTSGFISAGFTSPGVVATGGFATGVETVLVSSGLGEGVATTGVDVFTAVATSSEAGFEVTFDGAGAFVVAAGFSGVAVPAVGDVSGVLTVTGGLLTVGAGADGAGALASALRDTVPGVLLTACCGVDAGELDGGLADLLISDFGTAATTGVGLGVCEGAVTAGFGSGAEPVGAGLDATVAGGTVG